MRSFLCNKFLTFTVVFLVSFVPFQAFAMDEAPVNFSADAVSHNENTQIIVATGDVELIQEEQILHADKMVYDLQNDQVTASGNVSLLD